MHGGYLNNVTSHVTVKNIIILGISPSALKVFLAKEIHPLYGETPPLILNYDIFVDRIDSSLALPWYFCKGFELRCRFPIFGWQLVEVFNRNHILFLL